MDIFLMYYLKDNPKASKILHKQLSTIDCTLELDFDEEKAVVRGDIEKGPGGAFGGAAEKWEQQVDQIFISFTKTYVCQHVFEAKKIKKMLQDRSFLTDDMKVYTESGYAVVVGEAEDVKKKIEILDKSFPACIKLPVVENKLKLVSEEFNGEMATLYPEVKITRNTAMIILEGPDQKVQSGATKLDELVKKIKEKKVQLPSDLLTFIRTSGAITKYQLRFQQSLRNPVSLEVTSDLVLSSLSSVSLEEAAAAVQRELSVADVELQGAAGAALDLNQVKEILIKAKNLANLVELRVDFNFIPGPSGAPATKVRLVGYTEHVNKLKDRLHDYLMKQGPTQKKPNPGLVEDVKKKTAILKKSRPTCMMKLVVENQFKLVEEEFNGEMATLYPEVKITRNTAMVILEGPDQKVQSGATKLDKLVKKIKEKKVQLPSDLLTFIKTSGAITKYQLRFQQSLRNPVSLEVTSDLVLSSLSSVSLEEATAAVQRELSVADVALQGAAGAAPDLNQVKEILIKAKNQANLVEHRVDVSFIPGPSGAPATKVRLVGYTEHVNQLKDLLHDYLKKQGPTRLMKPVVENRLKLVCEEFNREMATLYPEVKITRNTAMIILEGPDQKVQSGATKLDELVKKIKEKKVQLPSHLLTFIKTSGAITKYQLRFQQSLRNPVSLTVTSYLVLSSLSSVSLEEAAAAVQRELSVADVALQGAAGAAPDLNQVKEILIKAKNQANLVELRVDVTFIPGPSGAPATKVRLVGYTEHVNKLKELLHDYLMNQVATYTYCSIM